MRTTATTKRTACTIAAFCLIVSMPFAGFAAPASADTGTDVAQADTESETEEEGWGLFGTEGILAGILAGIWIFLMVIVGLGIVIFFGSFLFLPLIGMAKEFFDD